MKRRAAVLAGLTLMALPLAALAHAHLEQSEPADGAVVAASPARIALHFSEAVQLTLLSVTPEDQAKPQKLGPLPTAAAAQLSVPAPALAPGRYEVRFRVISADGHVMAGSVHFAVAPH
jgi:methionine-rich copper-binding protein CopC